MLLEHCRSLKRINILQMIVTDKISGGESFTRWLVGDEGSEGERRGLKGAKVIFD